MSRNILAHPVTNKELIDFLDSLSELYSYENTRTVGDMRLIYIKELKDLVPPLKCKYLKPGEVTCQYHNLHCSSPNCKE